MGRKITRISKDFTRAVVIDGVTHVLVIGTHGLTIRKLKQPKRTAIPVTWRELAREGGLLDAAELQTRPLLAACVRQNCGASRPAARSAAV